MPHPPPLYVFVPLPPATDPAALHQLVGEAQQYAEACQVTGADLSPLEQLGWLVVQALERP